MTNTITTVKGKTLTVKKILNAPRELVWDVWTKPAHMVHWWGPVGFTTTGGPMDLKAGGHWDFIMHGPDGRDYPNRIVFLEVVKPVQLVYKHTGDADTEPVDFHVTVSLEADGHQTKLTIQSVFTSAEELERVNRKYGAIQGTTDTAGRLEEYLVNMKTGLQVAVTMNMPVKNVFTALTANISQWWTAAFEGEAANTNDHFTVRFGNTYKTFLVEEIIPGKKIIWKCTDAFIDAPSVNNKNEWLGTKIIWELNQSGSSTHVNMIHYGLTPLLDCYEICEQGWAQFIKSLQHFVQTGTGNPYNPTGILIEAN